MIEGREVLLQQQDHLLEQNESAAPYFLRDLIAAGTPTFGEEGWRRRSSRQECYQKPELATSITCLDDKPTAVAVKLRKVVSKRETLENCMSSSYQNGIFTKNGSFSSCSSSSCSTKFSEHKLIESNASENQLSLKDEWSHSGKEDQQLKDVQKRKKKEIMLASLEVDVGLSKQQHHNQQKQQQQSIMLVSFSPSNSPISRFLSPKEADLSSENQDYYLQCNPQHTPRARSIPLINQWSGHPKISKRSPLFDKFGDRPERGTCNVSAGAGVHTHGDNLNNRKQSTKTAGNSSSSGVNHQIQDISSIEGGYQDHLQVLLSARWASERKGTQTYKKSREGQNLNLQDNQWTYEEQENSEKKVETVTNRQHLRVRSNTLGMVIPTLGTPSYNYSRSSSIWEGSHTKPNQQQKYSQQPPCPFLKASSPIKKNRHYLFESATAAEAAAAAAVVTPVGLLRDETTSHSCNLEKLNHLQMINMQDNQKSKQNTNNQYNNNNATATPSQPSKQQKFCLSLLKKKEATQKSGQKLHYLEDKNTAAAVLATESTSCDNRNTHRNQRYNNTNNTIDTINDLSENITFSLPSFSPQVLLQQHSLPYPRILNDHPPHNLSPAFLQENNNRQRTTTNTYIGQQDCTLMKPQQPLAAARRNSLKLNNIILPVSAKDLAPTQANIENLYDPIDNLHSRHLPASTANKANSLIQCNKIKHVLKKQSESPTAEKQQYHIPAKNSNIVIDTNLKNNNINNNNNLLAQLNSALGQLSNIKSQKDSSVPSRRCSFNFHQAAVLQSLTSTPGSTARNITSIHN